MLPDTAPVALYEQPARVVAIRAIESLAQWRAWVVLVSTYAARDLLFVGDRLVVIVVVFYHLILFYWLRALAATRWLASLFAGEGVWCRRLLVAGNGLDAAILLCRRERRGGGVRSGLRRLGGWLCASSRAPHWRRHCYVSTPPMCVVDLSKQSAAICNRMECSADWSIGLGHRHSKCCVEGAREGRLEDPMTGKQPDL